jgi:glucose/arabinose dehydrogenase
MRAYLVVLAGAALVLAGCAAGGQAGAPNWKPKPSFSGEGYAPPANGQPVQPASPSPSGRRPSSSPGSKKPGDGAVVATHLAAPTGIAILPDNTALVGERTTGRIVRVQPMPDQPVQTVRTIPGLSTRGDGGLLDLALSPNYREDDLIFAYVTTPKDNRVIAFTLKGPITPVLTGIPSGRTGNTGRITFSADGSLLIGTGDAGHPALARDPHSLAGKILRVSDIGKPAQGNPTRGSRVFDSGLTHTDGLCATTDSTLAFQTESVPSAAADPIFQVLPSKAFGLDANSDQPVGHLPDTSRSPGGCAILNNTLFATSLDGQALLASRVSATPSGAVKLGSWSMTLHNRYGRLRTVVAAPDGALWLTTSNKDGKGKPVPADERVLRIIPTGGGGGDNPV